MAHHSIHFASITGNFASPIVTISPISLQEGCKKGRGTKQTLEGGGGN